MLVHHLSPEWDARESKDHPGRVYYYNKETGESSWVSPLPFFHIRHGGGGWPPIVYVSHILVKHRESDDPRSPHKQVTRPRISAFEKSKNILKDIAKGEKDFAELALSESDDYITYKNGGEIGWIRRGIFPPSFDRVAFSLGMGKISAQPVETPNGWHIIKRLG